MLVCGRKQVSFLIVGVMACALSGCAIERTGVSASSLSRMPWFNLELAPSKKENPNYQRSIARSNTDRVVVKPAMAPPQKVVHWPELPLPVFRREAQLLPVTNDTPDPKATDVAEKSERLIDFN